MGVVATEAGQESADALAVVVAVLVVEKEQPRRLRDDQAAGCREDAGSHVEA